MSVDKQFGTRTLLELSVGHTHSVEILFNLRRADLDWWNADLNDHRRQLYQVIGRSILPNEVGDEIDRHRKRMLGGGGGGVTIGEKNLKEQAGGGKEQEKGKKRKAPSSKKGKSKGGAATISASSSSISARTKKDNGQKKRSTDVTYVFGETIQLTYRTEEIRTAETATLLYNNRNNDQKDVTKEELSDGGSDDDDDDDEANTSTRSGQKRRRRTEDRKKASPPKQEASDAKGTVASFHQLKKLTKRIVIWCYPFDHTNPSAEPNNPENGGGGGFPRPELVPIASLFRQPE